MTNEQFNILCILRGMHDKALELRECSRQVFVENKTVAEAAKGRGAKFYRALWLQVKRIEKAKALCDAYCCKMDALPGEP